MAKPEKINLSFLLTVVLLVFTCGTAWSVVNYKTDQNTADIKSIKKTMADDHDMLIRIDEDVKKLIEKE